MKAGTEDIPDTIFI